ncbi:MAG: nucleotidyltransferase domain-containing protein [Phormidesmis sp.]
MQTAKGDSILNQAVQWSKRRTDIVAAALVGSWARGTAHADSDVDLMFLTPNAVAYRASQVWMTEIGWEVLGYRIQSWKDQRYGLVWSRHIYFEEGGEIECSFGLPSWADTQPIDPGTAGVVRKGCKILYDPEDLLMKLIARVSVLSVL